MNIIRIGGIVAGGNTILVTVDTGATVYATNGRKTVSAVAIGGVAKLKVEQGLWKVWAELDGQQTSEVEVIVTDSYYKEMSFAIPLSSLAEGALIKLNESGSGVNYFVGLHDYRSDLNGAGRTLVVRQYVHTKVKWGSGKNVYNDSNISSWMTGTFFPTLDSAVRTMAGTTKIQCVSSTSSLSTTTLSRTAFQLAVSEYGLEVDNYYTTNEGPTLPIISAMASLGTNGRLNGEWTRSPLVKDSSSRKAYISNGNRAGNAASTEHYARPAFTLPATALVSGSPNADGSYTLMV